MTVIVAAMEKPRPINSCWGGGTRVRGRSRDHANRDLLRVLEEERMTFKQLIHVVTTRVSRVQKESKCARQIVGGE